ncbi:unnamed protein product [Closterium sp. NIES-53]
MGSSAWSNPTESLSLFSHRASLISLAPYCAPFAPQAEILIPGNLSHPNLVRLLGYGIKYCTAVFLPCTLPFPFLSPLTAHSHSSPSPPTTGGDPSAGRSEPPQSTWCRCWGTALRATGRFWCMSWWRGATCTTGCTPTVSFHFDDWKEEDKSGGV